MTSQHRASHSRHMEGPDDGLGTQIDHAHDGFLVDEEDQPEHIRRDMLKLRGRRALLDLLQEQRVYIKSFYISFRGRFLRNETPAEEERAPSMAAGELNQLRQRCTVSGLRYV
ncbi:unnamed protein product [Fraxinus pennsylvanica]|uniref:Uncharacterized protein n=1 Tax=Fraxinus pennsylvanica TaxID=56036 RepID=A0AAD2A2D3_9LAMI|nr:unnamed protein product [Fraxinus pennsylvanica]